MSSDEFKEALKAGIDRALANRIRRLEAENERLRKALEKARWVICAMEPDDEYRKRHLPPPEPEDSLLVKELTELMNEPGSVTVYRESIFEEIIGIVRKHEREAK